ncbi:hypothetical protein evm_003321 [Chilo suppressalis]|nr:hypothetical protein evm_003321 [Chilo suppressalis]
MKWYLLYMFFVLVIVSLEAHRNNQVINRIIKLLKRRYAGHRNVIGAPAHPEDLPAAEPILPGHTLIRPSLKMLKSAVKYPQKDVKMAVYGNLDNLGITYGKTPYRVMYTGFRRSNNIVQSTILQAVRNIIESKDDPSDTDVIFIEAHNLDKQANLRPVERTFDDESSNENNARELSTDTSSEEEMWQSRRSQRYQSKKKRIKYRDRYMLYSSNSSSSSSDSSSDTSESSDYEKNPGNPYTLYREKYKQNWMWNHFMDGDHMNINPFAPNLNKLGPSGGDLFFGRKWWYFNQDDYKPLR